MADPETPSSPAAAPAPDRGDASSLEQAGAPVSRKGRSACDDKVLCERCGAEMFRMHAVWRCPECRFKTDCCGW